MARKNGSGFKMKKSPAKDLSNFFSTLGRKGTEERQKKQTQENQGMTNFEKRRAEKKSRKAGESKYQADIRRRGEKKAATQEGKRMNAEDEASRDAKTAKIKAEIQAAEEKKKKTKKASNKTKTKKKVVKPKSNDGPRVSKVKKKPKTIKQDVAPTPGPLDPKYIPSKKDKELTFEDFQRITKGGDKKVVYAEYPGKPIIDPLIKASSKIGKNITTWFDSLNEGEPKPEIRSGIRKKSPSKKRGYKMKRNK